MKIDRTNVESPGLIKYRDLDLGDLFIPARCDIHSSIWMKGRFHDIDMETGNTVTCEGDDADVREVRADLVVKSIS